MEKVKKVSDFEYKRVTQEEVIAVMKTATEIVKNASSVEEILSVRNGIVKDINCKFETQYALGYMRYTCNTKDEFYQAEKEYYDQVIPVIMQAQNEYFDAMLNTPFRKDLEKVLGESLFKKYEFAKKAHSPLTVEYEQEENAITTEYSKLMAEMKFVWEGEQVPMAIVRGKLQSGDREIRRKAAESIGQGLKANADKLDDIYDRLVKVRDKMAKKLGYKDYVELGYYNMARVDYNREMVENFRNNVVKDITPAVKKLKGQMAEKLGINQITFYDDAIFNVGKQPEPILTPQGILDAGLEMYKEMSPITGEFMQRMMDAEAFDVLSRDGKWGGGYCINFPDFNQPFILANFNGSSGDVDVITHEFGHALAMDFISKYGDYELAIGGNETAECHSMSMEFFCWKFMEKFFGEDCNKYLYKHLLDSFCFIPYGCMVDEFQHIVYSNPEQTPAERKQAWLMLEEKYRPYLVNDGIPYIEEGTRWQYQMHIYESPFYYIDYCLAQTVALGFLTEAQKDYQDAFNRYIEFCKAGGTKTFPKLIEDAKLPNPFGNGTLSEIAKNVLNLAKQLQ